MQRGEKTEVLLEPRLSSSQTSQVFGVNVAELKKRWPFLESELIFFSFSVEQRLISNLCQFYGCFCFFVFLFLNSVQIVHS